MQFFGGLKNHLSESNQKKNTKFNIRTDQILKANLQQLQFFICSEFCSGLLLVRVDDDDNEATVATINCKIMFGMEGEGVGEQDLLREVDEPIQLISPMLHFSPQLNLEASLSACELQLPVSEIQSLGNAPTHMFSLHARALTHTLLAYYSTCSDVTSRALPHSLAHSHSRSRSFHCHTRTLPPSAASSACTSHSMPCVHAHCPSLLRSPAPAVPLPWCVPVPVPRMRNV